METFTRSSLLNRCSMLSLRQCFRPHARRRLSRARPHSTKGLIVTCISVIFWKGNAPLQSTDVCVLMAQKGLCCMYGHDNINGINLNALTAIQTAHILFHWTCRITNPRRTAWHPTRDAEDSDVEGNVSHPSSMPASSSSLARQKCRSQLSDSSSTRV